MTSHSKTIARAAGVVAGATLASRLLGFLRDIVTAYVLGAGPMADAFFVAFRVPNLLRRLFGEGALTMAFIPVFSRARAKDGLQRAFAMTRATFIWQIALLSVLTLLAMVFAEPFTRLIAPGFASDPQLFAATTHMVRICFPYVVFISAVALCMGLLNSLGHFLSPALSPCLLNIVLILFALAGWLSGGEVAYWLAWGVLVAGVAQLGFQLPYLRKNGFSIKGPLQIMDPYVGRVGRLMGPTVFGAAVYQLNIIFGTMLASFLPHGSVSYLWYADRLVEFPLGVFGLAVSTAAMPSLSKLRAEGDTEGFRETLDTTLGLTLMISLPATAGLMALAHPVISTLFMRGAFDAADASATASALLAFAAGMPATSVARPMVSAYYAMEDTKTPVRIAAICMLVNIGVGGLLMQFIGHVGLALGVASASWMNALLLTMTMRRRTGWAPRMMKNVAVYGILSFAVGFGAYLTAGLGAWSLALIPLWGAAYAGAALLLRMSEATLLAGMLRERLNRS